MTSVTELSLLADLNIAPQKLPVRICDFELGVSARRFVSLRTLARSTDRSKFEHFPSGPKLLPPTGIKAARPKPGKGTLEPD